MKNNQNFSKLNLNDVIAYECHVCGLTKDLTSEVAHKGTFLGIIEKLDHIKSLGVNQLILMPVYDFEEGLSNVYGVPDHIEKTSPVQSKNYWGFAGGNYFSLKKKYSDVDAEGEFKTLVNEAHERCMEIIMMIYFQNDVNTEEMLKALKFWVDEYAVDGFFLNVNPFYLKVISDCSKLSDIKLYTYDIDYNLNYTNPDRIAVFDFEYRMHLRKLLRGDEDSFKEFVQYVRNKKKFIRIISVTSHNGFTLNDLYSYSHKHNEGNGEFNRDGEYYNFGDNCGVEGKTADIQINKSRLIRIKNALIMLLLSDGIPMLLAGDEEANSQNGNNNAYCQDNEISWIQYGHKFAPEIKKIISEIIDIRKSSGLFNHKEKLSEDRVNVHGVPGFSVHAGQAWDCRIENYTKCAGVMFAEDENYLYIAANFDKYEHILSIPHLPKDFIWSMIANTGEKISNNKELNTETKAETSDIKLKSYTVAVFAGRRINK